MYVYINTHTSRHGYVHICIYVCMYMYMYMCMYISIYTHIEVLGRKHFPCNNFVGLLKQAIISR